MARKKRARSDHAADMRGGRFIGIPTCVYNSAAYRALDTHARATLTVVLAGFSGFNNGKIAVSYDQIAADLGNSNRRRIAQSIATMIEHGLVAVESDREWKPRLAREYRLTFISTSTKGGSHIAATNDYLSWTPLKAFFRSDGASPADPLRGDGALPETPDTGDGALPAKNRASLCFPRSGGQPSGDGALLLICKPYVPGEMRLPGSRWTCPTCQAHFEVAGRAKLFCSETCRKKAERARSYQRQKHKTRKLSSSVWWGADRFLPAHVALSILGSAA